MQNNPQNHPEVSKWISEEYHDLNGSSYQILQTLPSSLEFSRIVCIGRPVLIRSNEMLHTIYHWTDNYLASMMGDRKITVAVTPNGQADAVTPSHDGRLYFVEPHSETMTMRTFLNALNADHQADISTTVNREVYYLQSQNGNLYTSRSFDLSGEDTSEFEPLREDIPSEIMWCSEALDRPPEAVNLWIGNSASVTSIHSDPYENIYSVIRGAKHFTLLPPTEGWCLKERMYPHAVYSRSEATSKLVLVPSPPDTPAVRWSSIPDPTVPGSLPPEAHPIHITVREGETLYLPAGWWHYVRQSEVTIAINHWYDMESRGMPWVWLNFLRGLQEPPSGNEDDQH